jgi:hypothetical protein
MQEYKKDLRIFKKHLSLLPTLWEGKESVLELKEADYNWRQMEWWAFYFEYKAKSLLNGKITIPGARYGNVQFDLRGNINWDLKASAIKTDNHKIILNDKIAMDRSVRVDGEHGEIIALCDVVYNDIDRTFQQWHTILKGGKSDYERSREQRTSVSRYRKTKAKLCEIIFLVLRKENLHDLPIMKQGRNSNGSPRNIKYMLDLENLGNIEKYRIEFTRN